MTTKPRLETKKAIDAHFGGPYGRCQKEGVITGGLPPRYGRGGTLP
jgi:hypothetical protein